MGRWKAGRLRVGERKEGRKRARAEHLFVIIVARIELRTDFSSYSRHGGSNGRRIHLSAHLSS